MDLEQLLKGKISDLISQSINNGYATQSKFLSLGELHLVENIKSDLVTKLTFGGYGEAERKIILFMPMDFDELDIDWNIRLLEVMPTDDGALTHRDYMGALLSLGIKKEMLGDIIVGDTTYIFCHSDILDYLLLNLDKVGNSRVEIKSIPYKNANIPTIEFELLAGSVASNRLDAIIAFLLNKPRTFACEYITTGRVMINSKEVKNTSLNLKPGDILSLKGFGRLVFDGSGELTRKGRVRIHLKKYK